MDYGFNYIVNKYCGRVYCGNAFCDTIEECVEFINDGFCDKALITDVNTEEVTKIELEEVKK